MTEDIVRTTIRINAVNCKFDSYSNSWEVTLEARTLSNNEQQMLHHLFPNTEERVWKLLQIENLIAAIAE